MALIGLPSTRLRKEGIGMVAVEQHIEYKRELLAGDLLTIHSSIKEVREKTILFVHEMTNQETQELAARTLLTGVCIDTTTRKTRPCHRTFESWRKAHSGRLISPPKTEKEPAQ